MSETPFAAEAVCAQKAPYEVEVKAGEIGMFERSHGRQA